MSSNKVTMDWISKLVNRTDSFPMVVDDVTGRFAKQCGWMHVKLWTEAMGESSGSSGGDEMEKWVSISFGRAVSNVDQTYMHMVCETVCDR